MLELIRAVCVKFDKDDITVEAPASVLNNVKGLISKANRQRAGNNNSGVRTPAQIKRDREAR